MDNVRPQTDFLLQKEKEWALQKSHALQCRTVEGIEYKREGLSVCLPANDDELRRYLLTRTHDDG